MKTSVVPVVVKIALIRKALAGELSLCGSEDGPINGLIFPKGIVDEESRREQARLMALTAGANGKRVTGGVTVRLQDVATQLGCSYHTVRKLAEGGQLHGIKSRGSYLFATEKVEEFSRKWMSLTPLACHVHTSVYGLCVYLRV